MGGSCCRLSQDGKYQSKHGSYMSEEWTSTQLQASRRSALSTNGIRNQGLPSDKGNVQSMIERHMMRPHKNHTEQPQPQQLVAVNSVANADQTDATSNALKNENEKNPSCTPETPDDTCKESKKGNLVLLPVSEEDFCSTCLEGYDKENPKILTKCKHHYHLPCILEWMERSNTCPTCEQVLFIDETYQE